MLKKTHFFVIGAPLLTVSVAPVYAETVPQSLESFEKEFRWLNISDCKRPLAKPPPPIRIKSPSVSKNNSATVSIRRWLDEDGNGLCELYDVQNLEKSYYTGKLYGYPYRAATYENGKWAVEYGSTGRWLPLILLDKVTGTRLNIFYAYGNAGYTEGGAGPRPDCESMRSTLAEGYMLLFHFPKFAKEDPVMDPTGIWNDYVSGWINSQYPERSILLESPVSEKCMMKYRLVIDAIAEKLGK
nr:hypothetical protein [uncultured Noviherbaspirillum sp.]